MTTNIIQRLVFVLVLLFDIGMVQTADPEPEPEPKVYSRDLETQLRMQLFSPYSVLQRPSERVVINVSLSILTVNEMSIKDQVLSLTGYLSLNWKDERLSWDSLDDYTPIRFLFSTETFVWRPALLIDNSVDGISIISNVNTPMRIKNTGHISWNPADIYTVSCESDIMYYPLDIQTCTLSLTSWAYTSNEITLTFDDEAVDMDAYTENGEWELISTSGLRSGSRSKGDNSFSNMKFSITIRRRPLFHVLNTLFPVALMAVLSAMVFKLPAESGEKIGFSLTVLLAYAVYLTLISDSIPSTSVTVCYLSIYLSLILAYGTLSVLCTILVLNVHSRTDEEDIPVWVRSVTTSVLMTCACWKRRCKLGGCNRKKVEPKSPNIVKVLSVSEIKANIPVNGKYPEIVEDDDESVPTAEDVLTWRIIAKVLDACFYNLFICLIVGTSGFFFGSLVNEYANV